MDETAIAALNERFADASAEETLRFALAEHAGRVAVSSSMSVEDVALMDLAARIDPAVEIFTLDTGRLPEETHALVAELRDRGMRIRTYVPDAARLEALLDGKGPLAFRASVDDRRACCAVRKVEPLRRALAGKTAWVTGLRRAQGPTRGTLERFSWDAANGGLLKVNPLVAWTDDEAWAYCRERGLPHNALYDRGYTSIGCAPCTRAVAPGEDARAGRWWWESPEHKECGLHR